MRVSHSRVDCWRQCPRKFKHRYIDEIAEPPDYSPTNPLVLGSTLDKAVESGMGVAEDYYWSNYHVATDEGETELMKINYWLQGLRKIFAGAEFQVKMEREGFIGFADAIVGDTLYDLKYSNDTERYRNSDQLHVYASELPVKPKKMAYVCVPKYSPQKYLEGETKEEYQARQAMLEELAFSDVQKYRRLIMEELKKLDIQIVWVEYDQSKVDKFWEDAKKMQEDTEYIPIKNDWCKYCAYKSLCPPKGRTKPRAEIEKVLNS